jgi:hypothetical protein
MARALMEVKKGDVQVYINDQDLALKAMQLIMQDSADRREYGQYSDCGNGMYKDCGKNTDYGKGRYTDYDKKYKQYRPWWNKHATVEIPVCRFVEKVMEAPIGKWEPIKEPIKERIKEPIEEPIKEPSKETSKEQIKEQIKEPIKEPIMEQIREPIKEPIMEQIREPIKEPFKETTNEQIVAATAGDGCEYLDDNIEQHAKAKKILSGMFAEKGEKTETDDKTEDEDKQAREEAREIRQQSKMAQWLGPMFEKQLKDIRADAAGRR